MKRTKLSEEPREIYVFTRERTDPAEPVFFVSILAIICLWLWLGLSFWIE